MAPSGRLELTWTNKHLRLITKADGDYEWVEPDDPRVAEVRLLHDVDTIGDLDDGPDNLLIEGDALHALTALNRTPALAEQYAGKVRLVYIDPPFNTGQAFAHYDNAIEHSVWLTMLRDRLVQVRRLLAPNGSVWVHLDDSEQHRARSILDEVLGGSNYLGTVIWQKADGPRNDLPNFSVDHDTIHVYGRSEQTKLNLNDRDKALNSIYSAIDGDDKPWYDDNPTAPSAHRNQTWVYGIQSPVTGELQYPARGRCWASKQDTVFTSLLEYADYELKVIDDDDLRAGILGVSAAEVRKGIPAIVLAGSLEDARKSVDRRKQAGPWPEFIIRSKGTIGRKRYQPTTGTNTWTLWFNSDVGHNREAKAKIKALFPGETPFATPKPERLLRRVIQVASGPGDIVLDCFAGSGTTAAVAYAGRRRVSPSRGNGAPWTRSRTLD